MHRSPCVGIVLRRIRTGIRNKARKVLKAVIGKVGKALTELNNCQNGMLRQGED